MFQMQTKFNLFVNDYVPFDVTLRLSKIFARPKQIIHKLLEYDL